MAEEWQFGKVLSSSLNVRKAPSLSAPRWDGVWPMNRISLIKPSIEGWNETLYHGMMKRCALYSANFPSVAGYERVSYIVAADIFSRVMKRFPYYYKRVFLYRHLYHMPYAEIALALNITECAARQAHSRVMRAFKNEALRHDQAVIE